MGVQCAVPFLRITNSDVMDKAPRNKKVDMIKGLSDTYLIQRQFKDVNALLMNIVDKLSRSGNPILSTAIQDITHVSQVLLNLEQGVSDQIKLKQSQLTALMNVGQMINSSLGLKRVLEEVMDSLIALMHAERGFLMLRDPNGQLSVRIGRGLDHIN